MPHDNNRKQSKFTRGEKCLYVHIIVTFVSILALALVYAAHLWRVPHAGDVLRVSRRRSPPGREVQLRGAGHAALTTMRGRRVCGAVRLRARWLAAPAHCVAARAHPDLADELPYWKVVSQLRNHLNIESDIVRGVVHSHFNRDDFSNNIGLFEQADTILMDEYTLDETAVSDELLLRHAHDTSVVTWPGGENEIGMLVIVRVTPIPSQRCRQQVVPVVELRTYEFCVHSKISNLSVEHGAAVIFGSEVRGFVAWGDKNGNLPVIILDIGFYRNWIDNCFETNIWQVLRRAPQQTQTPLSAV